MEAGFDRSGFTRRTALGRFVLGSVSQRVLTEALCSVRIARGRVDEPNSPVRIIVGTDGSRPSEEALKAVAPLKTEFNRNTEMRELMLKYTQALMAQISQNVGCNRLHEDRRRFARWLLEVRDRVEADEFPLTQKFMGEMLGVRREGVTNAARKLKREGVIDYSRGHIQILDLPRLQAASCECYKVLKDEYDRLLRSKD